MSLLCRDDSVETLLPSNTLSNGSSLPLFFLGEAKLGDVNAVEAVGWSDAEVNELWSVDNNVEGV